MASSEKKRAREQNAAARRDRALQKRTEKTAVPSADSSAVQIGIAAQFAKVDHPADSDA